MKNFELVIAGGGLTAARAIKSYRESGGSGHIALLSKESDLPYHRPALSKRYLRGETTDAPFAEDATFYRDHDVEVLLDTTATAVDPGARTVTTDAGSFHYDRLLIATGATPRRLTVPGANLDGVYALRTLRDSQAIRAAARSAEHAVVVGGGVLPNVDFLADSGLALENGVLVNQRFETQAPGVFAAGDVANFFDPLYGRQRRIEHWSNANYQGTEVGKVLAGSGSGYDTVSSFFSEVFGTTVKVFGDVSRFDELTTEGSLASGTLLIRYDAAGQLVGALTVGASDEFEALLKDLIAEHAP